MINTLSALLPRVGSLAPRTLSRDVGAGLVTASVAIAYYVSAAALLFPGALAPHVGMALGAALFGGAVLAAINAWRGSIALAATGAEPVTVPVLAGVTAAIASHANTQAALPTAYAAIILTTLAIGGVWWWLGAKRLGRWIRFVPYPVIGGFLASVGVLLLTGSLGLLEGRAMGLGMLQQLMTHGPSALTLTGIACGAAIWLASKRLRHPLVLPLGLLLLSALIHLGLAAQGASLSAAQASGWLLQLHSAWPSLPFDSSIWRNVDYSLLLSYSGTLFAAVAVSIIGLLLSDTSLEVALDVEADLDRDLRVLGLANIAAALGGGLTGGVSVSRTLLNRQAGAASRHSGYVQAALCILVMMGGAPLITLIPVPALGGLLFFMGLGLLNTWLLAGRKTLSRNDYLSVCAIVATTLMIDFVSAMFLGTLIACVDFALTAAKAGSVREHQHESPPRSQRRRKAAARASLDCYAHELRLLELHGFLFFGSVTALSERIHSQLKSQPGKAQHFIFDMSDVHAMDSSAAQTLGRIFKQLQALPDTGFALCGLSSRLHSTLARNITQLDCVATYSSQNEALEAWENACLTRHHSALSE